MLKSLLFYPHRCSIYQVLDNIKPFYHSQKICFILECSPIDRPDIPSWNVNFVLLEWTEYHPSSFFPVMFFCSLIYCISRNVCKVFFFVKGHKNMLNSSFLLWGVHTINIDTIFKLRLSEIHRCSWEMELCAVPYSYCGAQIIICYDEIHSQRERGLW